MDFDKELNEALTARKDLETNNEGMLLMMIFHKLLSYSKTPCQEPVD